MAAPLDERRNAIRKFRKQLKLSQAELAKLAGIGQPMLSRFELGTRDLSLEAFARVEDAITDALAQKKAALQRASRVNLSNLLSAQNPQGRLPMSDDVETVLDLALELSRLRHRLKISERLIACQRELIEFLVPYFKEADQKDARIDMLEQKVALLSDLLHVETQQALSHAKSEELREKLSISTPQEAKK